MFVQPILAGEEIYYDNNVDDTGENEYQKGSPDTFFIVQPPTTPSQSQSQAQIPSPAQAYAQSYVETHKHNHEDRHPLTSDSSHTPPSPTTKSILIQRRSIPRPSLMSHNSPMSKRTSNAHTAGHNSNHSNQNATASPHSNNANNISTNDKRTQSLNALPPQTLIHLLQIKEEERKRAKSLLKNALVQLEVEVDRGEVLAGRVKELEENVEREKAEKEKGGSLDVNPLKEMLAEQRGRVSGGAEVEGLKLKLNNTERELQRIKEDYRALQIERDDSDRALVRARTLAREMKEKALLIQAREQGRQEGFEEGLKQGRLSGEGSSGDASGSGRTRPRKSRERSTNRKSSSRRDTGPSQASLEAEASIAAIRSIAERENERVQLQLKAVERELNTERERMKNVEREKGQLEKMVREERRKIDEKEREKEKERVKEREDRETKERELRDALKKEVEERERVKEQMEKEKEKAREQMEREKERVRGQMEREKDRVREQMEREKERVREQMEKEKQDVERKLAEANKDKEKIEKQLKKEKEKAVPLPYLAMAPPPSTSTRVPEVSRTSSSDSHRQQRRRSSVDSYTSQASTIPFDMLQLPNGDRGGDLSVIHEVASPSATNSVTGSATAAGPPPTWYTNPPVDYGRKQNEDRGTSDIPGPQEPTNNHNHSSGPYPPYNPLRNQPDYLTPDMQNLRRSTGSTGSYEFVIVPPSRPESVLGGGDPDFNDTRNAHNPHNSNSNTGDFQYLSPNHRPIQLPQTQTRAESPAATPIPPRHATPHPRGDTSGLPTRPNSPAGIMGTIDMNGGFPPGFVPQSITDARGRSTPINGGGGFIPLAPGTGGGLGRPGTPNTQWNNSVISPAASSGPPPIYGNPITLERDKRREEADGYPATPPQPQSSAGADWSAPLAALHPPIFPITGLQQPFQHPPPGAAGGTWGGGSSTTMNDRSHTPSFEFSPASRTRPVIPGQTSASGGGGGGIAWSTTPNPNPRPGGFGGGGTTPGPRNQDLSPVVPTQTLGGSWNTPNRPPSGFGAGSMTPGPRNQDLSPIIPTQTLGGGGWNTPNRPPGSFGAGGMTPGPKNQDLSPVIPTQTLGGGRSTPNRPPSSFGAGGMTPGPRNQDLSPVFTNPTLGGGGDGWNTPSRAAGSFGGGASMTPGSRHQDLPIGGGGGSPYQPTFSIYGPPSVNGGRSSPFPAARSASPYAHDVEDMDREDEDPITAQNTKMNANLVVDVGMSMGAGGGRGGKAGKKGKKKR